MVNITANIVANIIAINYTLSAFPLYVSLYAVLIHAWGSGGGRDGSEGSGDSRGISRATRQGSGGGRDGSEGSGDSRGISRATRQGSVMSVASLSGFEVAATDA